MQLIASNTPLVFRVRRSKGFVKILSTKGTSIICTIREDDFDALVDEGYVECGDTRNDPLYERMVSVKNCNQIIMERCK